MTNPEPASGDADTQHAQANTTAALASALQSLAAQQRQALRPVLEAFAAQQREIFAPALEAFASQQRETIAPVFEAITPLPHEVLGRFSLATQLATSQLDFTALTSIGEAISSQVTALLDSFRLPEGLVDGFRRLGWELPASWPTDRIEDVYEMVRSTGIPIGSVAPAHVVEACLDAYEGGRDPEDVLHHYRGELVDLLDERAARLAALDDPSDAHTGFIDLVELLRTDRYHRAVVVTAFTIVDELLYKVTHDSYGAIGADRLDLSFDEQPLVGFRQQLAVHCLAPCYAYFDKTSRDRPSGLNRHAAIHTASPTQATSEHALIAALLVANLLDATFTESVG